MKQGIIRLSHRPDMATIEAEAPAKAGASAMDRASCQARATVDAILSRDEGDLVNSRWRLVHVEVGSDSKQSSEYQDITASRPSLIESQSEVEESHPIPPPNLSRPTSQHLSSADTRKLFCPFTRQHHVSSDSYNCLWKEARDCKGGQSQSPSRV